MANTRTKYLIADGYNIIGAWEYLRAIAREDLSLARDNLANQLMNFCAMSGETLILVFDAHASKTPGKQIKLARDRDDVVIFTRKGETADNFIERFVRAHTGALMRVASSDSLVQVMVFAHAARLSARELLLEVERAELGLNERMSTPRKKRRLEDGLNSGAFDELDKWRKR